MIGYPVSGHPLDGTHDFIKQKSKNIGKIYEWIEKMNHKVPTEIPIESQDEKVESSISQEDAQIIQSPIINEGSDMPDFSPEFEDGDVPSIPDIIIDTPTEKEPDEVVNATLIGVVTSIRKIQTKTGGMMLLAMVESAGFDFRLAIFSRDYEVYAPKVEEDRIIIVE